MKKKPTPPINFAKPLSTESEWTFELLSTYEQVLQQINDQHYQLDVYPNQIEVISAEQMMDAYSSVGMPVGYNHWSFGKHFVSVDKSYKRGQMGLAYEIVINSNPCIAYLMEENTMTMQALVIAHASFGHNSFFKGNYLFQTWTDAGSIIDYLVFAKKYIQQCEERYGLEEVETLLDACHALMNYGVDRYKRPSPISAEEEKRRQKEREAYLQTQVNELWRTIPKPSNSATKNTKKRFPEEPQENLLYFIEKNAPLLEPWQREVVRIVRKIAQYFYPQRQTQVMNEGWATFWHYTLLNHLYDEQYVTDGFMLEFLQYHTGVVYQPNFDHPYFNGINPYALGFAMMSDIRRICSQPTAEDKLWFPDIVGSDWLKTMKFAMQSFKDESFVQQFLSPKVMRDFHLFHLQDDDTAKHMEVGHIHDDSGYRILREKLSNQYNLSMNEPNIQVYEVNVSGDRSMLLRHTQHNRRPLEDNQCQAVLKHLHYLWKFDVKLESLYQDEVIKTYQCPEAPLSEND
jgi:spore cortex formation protein SpoVR/YcgB (stage V sporulation)